MAKQEKQEKQEKRKILVICSSRATYGYKRRIIGLINKSKKLKLQMIVTGMHLLKKYGYSFDDIKKDGYPIAAKIKMDFKNDTPLEWTKSLGKQMVNLAEVFNKLKPDMILVTGDRAEMFIAAATAVYMNIPVGHIQAGDVSGHIDGVVRHAITKLAHIHFPACRDSAERVRKMGEDKKRIFTVGAPQLDDIVQGKRLSKKELNELFGFDFNKPVILVVFHPVLVEYKDSQKQMKNIMETVREIGEQALIIFPNVDAGNRKIIETVEKYKNYPLIKTFKNINRQIFISLMANSSVLVGNSSAGILETPTLKLASINIGNRQCGRMQAKNVINSGYSKQEISKAIKKALTNKKFKAQLKKCVNPYGDGHSSKRIVKILENIKIDKKLLDKKITY